MKTIILGPPGTGKTTTLLNLVEDFLRAGTDIKKIGYFSFTKKAAWEATHRAEEKFMIDQKEIPYFRTLHSLAFRKLGIKKDQVMQQRHYKDLGKKLGLDLNKLFEVISTSTGSCWAVNSYCPIKGIGPNSPADKDYEGGFATALMYKDLGLAVDAAAETKSNINYGIQSYEKYKQVTENNKGNLDFSNIINE